MRIPSLAILLPLAEIALLITLGSRLGLGLTLLWILGTGVLGVVLLRRLGLRAAEAVQRGLHPGAAPDLARGALLGLAAVMLILPGFLTDAVGFLLLIPQLRSLLAGRISLRASARGATRPGGYSSRPDVIDGEFEVVQDPQPAPADRPRLDDQKSGWTRH